VLAVPSPGAGEALIAVTPAGNFANIMTRRGVYPYAP